MKSAGTRPAKSRARSLSSERSESWDFSSSHQRLGAIEGNQTTLTLTGLQGPGSLELFTAAGFGGTKRLWSSDEDRFTAFTVGRTHMHANWAFTAAGTYRIGIRATVTVAGEQQNADAVTLQAVQSPQGPLTAYQWFAKRAGDSGFAPIEGETAASYGFTATRELNGTEYLVKPYDGETVKAVSEPVTVTVASAPQGGSASKSVTVTINEADGALVISVDLADRDITLPAAVLNSAGDRWESTGALKPVTVTDTRSGRPGWTASGQVTDRFRTPDGTSFTGAHLGWTPTVVQPSDGQGVVAGQVTAPGVGLGAGAPLATAPGGAGRGTARLDAELRLSVRTDTGTLTLTAI